MIEVNKLNFSYGSEFRLSHIDFNVPRGEFIGILGENGCGKTTLLRLIGGTLRPHSGSIRILGREVQTYSSKQRERMLSVISQQAETSFDFSTYEIVAMGRYAYIAAFGSESERDRRIIRESMEKTGSWDYRARAVSELSAGELQRAIIARALAQEPQLLLMDEPTSALDIHHQIELMKTIRVMNRDHDLTVVIVSHDINLISECCSRVILLIQGEIAASGTPETVISTQNLQRAYQVSLTVNRSEFSGRPNVIFWEKLDSSR